MANKEYKFDVFISYRRAYGGWAYARFIAEKLKNAGFSTFLDVDILNQDAFGVNFEKVIQKALEQSKCVIFVLVENSLDRCVSDDNDVLKSEIITAIKLKKYLFPIQGRNLKIPANLDPRIKSLFNKDLVTINDANWKQVISKLISDLSKLTNKKPKSLENNGTYLGILSVNKSMNYIIDYGVSSIQKDIKEKEIEVYQRNAKKLFNSNSNNVELKVVPVKKEK